MFFSLSCLMISSYKVLLVCQFPYSPPEMSVGNLCRMAPAWVSPLLCLLCYALHRGRGGIPLADEFRDSGFWSLPLYWYVGIFAGRHFSCSCSCQFNNNSSSCRSTECRQLSAAAAADSNSSRLLKVPQLGFGNRTLWVHRKKYFEKISFDFGWISLFNKNPKIS